MKMSIQLKFSYFQKAEENLKNVKPMSIDPTTFRAVTERPNNYATSSEGKSRFDIQSPLTILNTTILNNSHNS